ncbi:MAG: tryptophan-rich sensory protein [Bacteroidaceae bacterium]|nr:tryptophan-rich sensory protein [Bacteroidaceae bacterium]
MKRFLPILSFVVISFAVGYLSSVIQGPSMQEWYPSLVKSSLNPPGIVFAIVWPVLYLLMGISAGIIWNMRSIYTWLTIFLFFVQLGLNLLWSVTFFGMQAPVVALVVLTLLFVAVLMYMAIAYMQRHLVAYLNIPYLLWLLFALYLNGFVVLYN